MYGRSKMFGLYSRTKLHKKVHKQQPRKAIVQAGVDIDQDKALCQRLMASPPMRLKAVIKKNDSQIQKEDN